MDSLTKAIPELSKFTKMNPDGNITIDFSNSEAVLCLNKALLKKRYNLDWDIPKGQLCPPIPGRIDYLYYINDLVGEGNKTVMDIGCGASLIYSLLARKEFNWNVISSDISKTSLEHANSLLKLNSLNRIELKYQKDSKDIFKGIIDKSQFIDACICNPPFFKSSREAEKVSTRKNRNLNLPSNNRNFKGSDNELWCEGGEVGFILRMIEESQAYANCIGWFTSLVSKKDSLSPIIRRLKKHKVEEFKVVEMTTKNKVSRFIAWRY